VAGTRFVDLERFWCPRGYRVDLTDEGYLIDPHGTGAGLFNVHLQSSGALTGHRGVVLLGEPGTGKSTVTRQLQAGGRSADGYQILRVDLALYSSDQAVISQVFQRGQIARWAEDPFPLVLVLDGFDDCWRHVPSLPELLADQLRQRSSARLRVMITCRTAVWQAAVEELLQDALGAVATTEGAATDGAVGGLRAGTDAASRHRAGG
jgi:hypothetical protein